MKVTTWSPGNGCVIQIDYTNDDNGVPVESVGDLMTVRGSGYEQYTDINDLFDACKLFSQQNSGGE